MSQTEAQETSVLVQVSNAMVRLHKEQFGRGPTQARTYFAGPHAMVCILEDALLPAERKLVALGDPARVRDSRSAFQAATAQELTTTVEGIVQRKVRSFASAIDVHADTVFENFVFERSPGDDGST